MKLCVVGEGAAARSHMEALAHIDDVEVGFLVGRDPDTTERLAIQHGVSGWGEDLGEALKTPRIDAVILATPTPLHAAQALQVLERGKHVLIEIPMADTLADATAVVAAQRSSGQVAMVCHTRRFNRGHRWIHDRIRSNELRLQHLIVDTLFFRRTNTNALGEPRDWTDHLLWHHACHTVDLFQYQTSGTVGSTWAHQGPTHPDMGIVMDMSIGLACATSGALCTLALSFNNQGRFGTVFRYICDAGTFVARYDDLLDGDGDPLDLSEAGPQDGIEAQDREFISAIREGREPNASVARCLPTMRTLDRIQTQLEGTSLRDPVVPLPRSLGG